MILEKDIRDAIKDIIEGVEDVGVVLNRERDTRTSGNELYNLLVDLNPDGIAKGWLIHYYGFPIQVPGESNCDIATTHRYILENVYPYDDTGTIASHELHKEMIEKVNMAFWDEMDLGLGNDVQHGFLQCDQPFRLGEWNMGADRVLTHYALLRLDVQVINTV